MGADNSAPFLLRKKDIMDTAITLNLLLGIFGIVVAVVAFFTAVKKVIDFINQEHDKMQKYDSYQKQIDDAHDYAQKELQKIKKEMNDKVEQTHADTEAKMQQLIAEQYILTESMLAVLEGLKQLNCNGPVSEAKIKLEKHLNTMAHDGI